jgi:hypothetical protein
MTQAIPVRVESHAGYKADEYPRCFYWEGRKYNILQVTDRWYQGYMDPEQGASFYFRVATACGGQYLLKYEKEDDQWYLCR